MNYKNTSDLIIRSFKNALTPKEQEKLDSWKNESIDNLNSYNSYKDVWQASNSYQPTLSFDSDKAYQKHMSAIKSNEEPIKIVKPSSTKRLYLKIISAAAIFILLIAAFNFFTDQGTTFIASERAQFVSLEDNSSVWLEKGSQLKVNVGFGTKNRNVALKGKAFFDVVPNANIPFNIESKSFDVSVVGTSFTVADDGADHSVSVLTGKVLVESEMDQELLAPNQKLVVLDNAAFKIAESTLDDFSWRNSDLSFDDAPLAQVIRDINLYHNNKLSIPSADMILDCTFTSSSLIQETFEQIIQILEKSFGTEAVYNDAGKIVFENLVCN